MSINKLIVQKFPITCRGRDMEGNKVLDTPAKFELKIYQGASETTITSDVSDCEYNTGGHGQRCKASHPNVDKIGKGILCPYSFDIPYALEKKETNS